jgi:protocatechuate 3,4-dioxygenase beta subunit
MPRITRFVALGFTLLWLGHGSAAACEPRQPTPATDPGPHDFSAGVDEPRLWQEGDPGEPLFLRARVVDSCGRPLAGARVRVVHANAFGAHEVDRWRADLSTDERGGFRLATVFPGYTGGLPRHIHFIIDHPEHPQLVTRLFFKNDPSIDHGVEDLAMVLEQVDRDGGTGWLAAYEFVLATPR